MNFTISAIKADVGSIGGHTNPAPIMIAKARECLAKAVQDSLLLDGFVGFTGDDIALIMTHTHGSDNTDIHQFAWKTFIEISHVAQSLGCFAAGQDLLVDAPSGNIRGAGPGVAEISFNFNEESIRPAESFMIFAADKCSPGAFNLPFFLAFADPMYCSGLMLPHMMQGFAFNIINMANTNGHNQGIFNLPEDYYELSFLLRDNERFAISSIFSRSHENMQALSASTDRLHSIAGHYVGKDDPIAIIRNQGIFPAPEEILLPFTKAHYVGGGTRGSHIMPLMPVPLNTPVTGPYCLPIISCIGFSLAPNGTFSSTYVDYFNNPSWDLVRLKAQEKAIEMRLQGWSGAAMLPYNELEYSGFRKTFATLLERFTT
jgi:fructose 1,6-bisphosphate aldolase/phosphatase